MTVWSYYDVGLFAHVAGFTSQDLVVAIAITTPESSRNDHRRYVTSREDSRGLWQINTYAHPQFDKLRLYEPQYNANAAYQVYQRAKRTFEPWTTYTSGKYLKYMGEATKAVDQMISVGINVYIPADFAYIPPPTPAQPPTPKPDSGTVWSNEVDTWTGLLIATAAQMALYSVAWDDLAHT